MVLDNFQSDIFDKLIREEKKYVTDFSGFTFFRNNLSVYPTTFASIPLILTGEKLKNNEKYRDYIKRSYSSDRSIPRTFRRAGCEVQLFPWQPAHVLLDPEVADNFLEGHRDVLRAVEQGLFLADLSLFTVAPPAMKRWMFTPFSKDWFFHRAGIAFYRFASTFIYEIHHDLTSRGDFAADENLFTPEKLALSQDLVFLDGFLQRCRVENKGREIFKFIHLSGAHPPFIFDKSMEVVLDGVLSRERYIDHCRAAIEICTRWLAKLRERGLYDSSTIVIMADHGGGYPMEPSAGDCLQTHGLALLLVKGFDAGGPLRVSDAPMSSADVLEYFKASLIGKGEQVKLEECWGKFPPDRRREFDIVRGWVERDTSTPAVEYFVTGDAWRQASWREAAEFTLR